MWYPREASTFNQDSKVSIFIWKLSAILNSKFIQVIVTCRLILKTRVIICQVAAESVHVYARGTQENLAPFFNQDSKVSLFIWKLSSILNSKFILLF